VNGRGGRAPEQNDKAEFIFPHLIFPAEWLLWKGMNMENEMI
jgi:hypothetical protein